MFLYTCRDNSTVGINKRWKTTIKGGLRWAGSGGENDGGLIISYGLQRTQDLGFYRSMTYCHIPFTLKQVEGSKANCLQTFIYKVCSYN